MTSATAHAGTCEDLIAAIERGSGATLDRGEPQGAPWYRFAHRGASRITVTCYGADTPPSAEIMREGPEPPEEFYSLVGDIGAALLTGESRTIRARAQSCSAGTLKTHDLVKQTDEISCLSQIGEGSERPATLTLYIAATAREASTSPREAASQSAKVSASKVPSRKPQLAARKHHPSDACIIFGN